VNGARRSEANDAILLKVNVSDFWNAGNLSSFTSITVNEERDVCLGLDGGVGIWLFGKQLNN
jgi:hypothetical protein